MYTPDPGDGVQRPRGGRACDTCRKKKIRCDGGSLDDPCSNCRTARRDCTFDENAKKRNPPKGYVEQLERRLETMETFLASLNLTLPPGTEGVMTADQSDSSFQPPDASASPTDSSTVYDDRPEGIILAPFSAPEYVQGTEAPTQFSVASTGRSFITFGPDEASNTLIGQELDASLANDIDQMSLEAGRYIGRSSGLTLAHTITSYTRTNGVSGSGTNGLASSSNTSSPVGPAPYQADRAWGSIRDKDDICYVRHERQSVSPVAGTSKSVVKAENQCFHERRMEAESRTGIKLNPLPDDDLVETLIALFFDKIAPTYPVVHKPSFMSDYNKKKHDAHPAFRGLLFSVLAIASRFSDDPRVLDETGSGLKSKLEGPPSGEARGYMYWFAAWRLQTPVSSAASLYDLQSLCLSCLYLMGASTPISAWLALGMAIRRAQDLGCHRQRNQIWRTSLLRDQLRKRVWWTLYSLDRKLSAGLGRPLAIQDEDVDLDLPLEVDDETLADLNTARTAEEVPAMPSTKPNLIMGFNCHVRLAKILGKALRTIYAIKRDDVRRDKLPLWEQRTAAELDSALNQWLEQLPAHLKWNAEDPHPQYGVQSAECLMSYYEVQILVHRDFLTPEQQSMLGFPSLAICTNAARSLSHLLAGVKRAGLLDMLWLNAPLASISAALILLVNHLGHANVRTLSSSSVQDVQKCLDVLSDLSERSAIAQRCYLGLVRLRDAGFTAAKAASVDQTLKRTRQPSVADFRGAQAGSSGFEPQQKRDRPDFATSPTDVVAPPLPFNTQQLSLDAFNGDPSFAVVPDIFNGVNADGFGGGLAPADFNQFLGMAALNSPPVQMPYQSYRAGSYPAVSPLASRSGAYGMPLSGETPYQVQPSGDQSSWPPANFAPGELDLMAVWPGPMATPAYAAYSPDYFMNMGVSGNDTTPSPASSSHVAGSTAKPAEVGVMVSDQAVTRIGAVSVQGRVTDEDDAPASPSSATTFALNGSHAQAGNGPNNEDNDEDDEEAEEHEADIQDTDDADPFSDVPEDTPELELTHARLRNIGSLRLKRFASLTRLCLRQNLIPSLVSKDGEPAQPLSALPKLEDLDLYDNRIARLEGLDGLTHLTSLDLSFNLIREIPEGVFKDCKALSTVYFIQNKIGKIQHLEDLKPTLTSLELGGNRLRKLEGLDQLTQLTELWLGKNKIPKLENLSTLSHLKILSIQSNRLTRIEGLEMLQSLEELYISHNGLTTLAGLEKNTSLKTLDVAGNRLTDIGTVKLLTNLEELWANDNKLADFQALEEVLSASVHPALDTVYFEGNPFQRTLGTTYRRKLMLMLPHLKQLDATFTS
ncbi:uncharacterized protein L969DRAFT_76596 [Mixia osmundae IAM 14324]|uniref:Zn(2)-C6 fungal-type domain-containing protein n=1 Tax=Mixia osmundae (strain CBS 9802 / IAM 14324 / JCM 22182 / KY 12970) TaxID=764103 RepID=G7E7N4_MIXOS|nr:uncharacterized protein L969DRAFT_76596 [Mixia osmundae IAM 14324]KEI38444.1 hypothetical protein L969DRAFT_76596 [Mixia osmundae IAM 14324]GAA98844.1 hypothetical protein E5Q_05532 [Mixia osmundae IAM 14324]